MHKSQIRLVLTEGTPLRSQRFHPLDGPDCKHIHLAFTAGLLVRIDLLLRDDVLDPVCIEAERRSSSAASPSALKTSNGSKAPGSRFTFGAAARRRGAGAEAGTAAADPSDGTAKALSIAFAKRGVRAASSATT